MRQILYTCDNIKRIYLCAYTNAYISNGALFFVNTLTNINFSINGEEEYIRKILNGLLTGIEEEQLIRVLAEIGGENVYKLLIQEGMVE